MVIASYVLYQAAALSSLDSITIIVPPTSADARMQRRAAPRQNYPPLFNEERTWECLLDSQKILETAIKVLMTD